MSVKQAAKKKMTDAQRIEFAKQIEDFYESSYADLKKVATFSFVKGIATGLGVLVGGTIAVSLLLWVLSLLSEIPFVGNISKSAEHSIHEATE